MCINTIIAYCTINFQHPIPTSTIVAYIITITITNFNGDIENTYTKFLFTNQETKDVFCACYVFIWQRLRKKKQGALWL